MVVLACTALKAAAANSINTAENTTQDTESDLDEASTCIEIDEYNIKATSSQNT